jgi:hypothetical protein
MFAPRVAMLAQSFGQTAVVRALLLRLLSKSRQAGRNALDVGASRVVRKKTLRDSPAHNDDWCLAGVMGDVQQQLLVMAARNWTQSRLEPQHKALCELANNGLECAHSTCSYVVIRSYAIDVLTVFCRFHGICLKS